jgi:hypothetical protein
LALVEQVAHLLAQTVLLVVILFLIPLLHQEGVMVRVRKAQIQQTVVMEVQVAVLLVALVVQEQAVQEIHQAQAQAKVTMEEVRAMQSQVEAVVLQEVALVP